MATIREDVVSIGFEIDNPFRELTENIERMQDTLVSGMDESIRSLQSLTRETDDFNENMRDTTETTNQAHRAIRRAADNDFDKPTNGLKELVKQAGKAVVSIGKIGIKGLVMGATAATAAVAGLVTSSVKAYATYEQLAGGVETLFGTGGKSIGEYAASVGKSVNEVQAEYDKLMMSQNTVFQNANDAYKTAGLSANEYMETVTSFSASLLQSVGGDTQKAAEYADMAITDMADNANKMGTDMGLIQNAYQGFAKQNYTMLDNLKLGKQSTIAQYKPCENDENLILVA